jgi:hypothetical protein
VKRIGILRLAIMKKFSSSKTTRQSHGCCETSWNTTGLSSRPLKRARSTTSSFACATSSNRTQSIRPVSGGVWRWLSIDYLWLPVGELQATRTGQAARIIFRFSSPRSCPGETGQCRRGCYRRPAIAKWPFTRAPSATLTVGASRSASTVAVCITTIRPSAFSRPVTAPPMTIV